jgi:hypothetical protein
MLQDSSTCFHERSETPQTAQHTRTVLGDPKTDQNTSRIANYPEIFEQIVETPLDTQITDYIRIPQIPDSHYCLDSRIHVPGYKPGYYPPAKGCEPNSGSSWI